MARADLLKGVLIIVSGCSIFALIEMFLNDRALTIFGIFISIVFGIWRPDMSSLKKIWISLKRKESPRIYRKRIMKMATKGRDNLVTLKREHFISESDTQWQHCFLGAHTTDHITFWYCEKHPTRDINAELDNRDFYEKVILSQKPVVLLLIPMKVIDETDPDRCLCTVQQCGEPKAYARVTEPFYKASELCIDVTEHGFGVISFVVGRYHYSGIKSNIPLRFLEDMGLCRSNSPSLIIYVPAYRKRSPVFFRVNEEELADIFGLR